MGMICRCCHGKKCKSQSPGIMIIGLFPKNKKIFKSGMLYFTGKWALLGRSVSPSSTLSRGSILTKNFTKSCTSYFIHTLNKWNI